MHIKKLVLHQPYTKTLSLIAPSILNNYTPLFRLNNNVMLSSLLINLFPLISISFPSCHLMERSNFLKKWYIEQYGPHADKGGAPPPPPPPPSSMKKKKYGKVLHIDGNAVYLDSSLAIYEKFNLPVIGINIAEEKQPEIIVSLLNKYRPNIVVITGHDALDKDHITSLDLNDYKNSKYFVECVKLARAHTPSYDELVIIAGGCRSHYEALMEAGANFASSPNRILINVTDPTYIACKIAMTPIREILSASFIVAGISSGLYAFGGLETRGQSRVIEPGF